MKHLFSLTIIAAIVANAAALWLNYTRPYPQPVITVNGEQVHFVKAITMESLNRRVQYMARRGWMCRTAPQVVQPFAMVVMHRPNILRHTMAKHPDGPVEDVLKKWEAQDQSILRTLSEQRRQQTPKADRIHGRLYLPTPIPEMTQEFKA